MSGSAVLESARSVRGHTYTRVEENAADGSGAAGQRTRVEDTELPIAHRLSYSPPPNRSQRPVSMSKLEISVLKYFANMESSKGWTGGSSRPEGCVQGSSVAPTSRRRGGNGWSHRWPL